MSNAPDSSLTAVLPRPSILVDPCVLLDEHGLWATARLQGATAREVDLYLPSRRTIRRVEVGHGDDALNQLGHGWRQRLLSALDKTLTKPLRLVVDPRRSDGVASPILDGSLTPLQPAVHALATVLGANSYTVAGYAVEFSIHEPRHARLASGAASVFGPHASALFRPADAIACIGALVQHVTRNRPARHPLGSTPALRIARYVRSATPRACGRNTLEAQHGRINAFLHALGARSEHTLVDEGCSGTGRGRSGIDGILRLAERGEIDAVVATSADRLFRTAAAFDRFLAQLRARGVALFLVEHSSLMGLDEGLPPVRRRGRR